MIVKKKIWRNELKREKRIRCVVKAEIQLTNNMKIQTLNRKLSMANPFKIPMMKESARERFLTCLEMRKQPNHGPVFAEMLLSGFSLHLTFPAFSIGTELNMAAQGTVTTSLDHLSLKANNQ